MNRVSQTTAIIPAFALWLAAAMPHPAVAQIKVGLVGGMTRDVSSGKPVGGAQIVAHSLRRRMDSATLTNAEGIFTFTNLEPGTYEFAASKDGFETSSKEVEVVARETVRVDLPLQ